MVETTGELSKLLVIHSLPFYTTYMNLESELQGQHWRYAVVTH